MCKLLKLGVIFVVLSAPFYGLSVFAGDGVKISDLRVVGIGQTLIESNIVPRPRTFTVTACHPKDSELTLLFRDAQFGISESATTFRLKEGDSIVVLSFTRSNERLLDSILMDLKIEFRKFDTGCVGTFHITLTARPTPK